MKRGIITAAILGLAALPAAAGENYAPYPGTGYYNPGTNYAPMPAGYAGTNHAPVQAGYAGTNHAPVQAGYAGPNYGPAPAGYAGPNSGGACGCNACGARGQSDFRERLGRFWDFLCYKPTIPCECLPRPTPYHPPLTAWFPCKPTGPCQADCATGDRNRLLGRHFGQCGACATGAGCGAGPVSLGTPAVQQPLPRPPMANYYTTQTRPAPPPAYDPNAGPQGYTVSKPAYDPNSAPQSYTVSKPAYSNRIQPTPLPTPPAATPTANPPQSSYGFYPPRN